MTPPDSPPKVSVIMPVYNGARFIGPALESALAQDFPDFEVVVVNDGSTDGSADIARAFQQRDARVRVFDQPNGGFCAARNAAIAQARGTYLALLDSDDLWLPPHLRRAVAALDEDPSVVLVHANVRFVDQDGHVISEFLDNRAWPQWAHDPFQAILLRYEHVACPTTVFRTDLFRELGGFDLRYNYLGCEDRDAWLRMSRHGTIRHLAYHGADYRMHMGGVSRNHERMNRARRLLVERMRDFPEGRQLYRAARAAAAVSEAESFDVTTSLVPRLTRYLWALGWWPTERRAWRGIASSLRAAWRS